MLRINMNFNFKVVACVIMALVAVGQVQAAVALGKKCPKWNEDYKTVQNLDLDRYKGRWYEVYRDKEIPFEWTTTCVTATYTISDAANGTIDLKNRGWFWWFFFSYFSVNGKGKCFGSEGRCIIDFSPNPNFSVTPHYEVLYTDYTKYSFIYSCRETWFGLGIQEFIWILSREKTIPDSDLK